MLLKNDVKPAFAYATSAGENTQTNAKKDAFIHMSADGDDFGNFSSSASARDTKQPRKKQRKEPAPAKKRSLKPFLFAAIAIIAIIILIAIVVAVFNAPKSGAKIEDTAYFCYVDSEGKYHVVVDGEEIKNVFENEIELIPAANNSFAYILESIESDERGNSGIKMHILDGKKLKSAEGLIDEYVTFAKCKPGIVYKYNQSYGIFKGDNEDIITQEKTAKNFIISDDAKTIVYTVESKKKEDLNILNCFQGLIEEEIYEGLTPVAISPDGRYIYGTADSSETNNLYYIDLNKKEIEPKAITNKSYGTFSKISEMNAEGNEIVFCTAIDDNIVSFFYQIGDKKPTTLGQGIFALANSNPSRLAPDTFKDNYFTAKKAVSVEDEEGEIFEEDKVITYRFKNNGDKAVTLLASAEGKFSADGKYFYFISEEEGKTQLARIPLSSSDYEKDIQKFHNKPIDFALTQKGDIYVLSESGNESTANLIFLNSSSVETKHPISKYADKDSLRICANTVYFTETIENSEGGSTTIYTSTDGSAKLKADFAGKELSESPSVVMSAGRNGYAFFIDENDTMCLFYTSNGKTFELVSEDSTLPGTEVNTDKKDESDKKEDDKKEDESSKKDDSIG